MRRYLEPNGNDRILPTQKLIDNTHARKSGITPGNNSQKELKDLKIECNSKIETCRGDLSDAQSQKGITHLEFNRNRL